MDTDVTEMLLGVIAFLFVACICWLFISGGTATDSSGKTESHRTMLEQVKSNATNQFDQRDGAWDKNN